MRLGGGVYICAELVIEIAIDCRTSSKTPERVAKARQEGHG
jgi:hypothetical protein